MGKVVKLEIPEPIVHKGRERFVSGWSTAGIGQWLINKKLGEQYTTMSEVAGTAYTRDSEVNRQKVRNNLPSLRRWLKDRDEFLLVRFSGIRQTIAIKVCNPASENDRQSAMDQLMRLEARCEIDQAERQRWEQLLFLQKSDGEEPIS